MKPIIIEMKNMNDRLTILSAYEKSLDGDVTELENLTNNRYYDEFINRKNLLYINTNLNESDISNQIALYQENIDCINISITQYNEKINKLNIVKQCIVNRNNTFDTSEEISYSLVSSYLATYDYTTLQYDNQISEYQRQIDDYNEQINNIETLENIDVENLKKQRDY